MAVYGNGNIHLKNYVPPPHSVAVRSLNGPTTGDVNTLYQFSASAADSQDQMVRYTFDWGDGSPQTWTDYYPSYTTVNANHSWSSEEPFSVKVRAQCESGVNSSWSNPHTMKIGQTLTVLAYNQDGRQLYPALWIDGVYVGCAGTYGVTTGDHQIGVIGGGLEYYEGHYYFHIFCWYYYDGIYNSSNPITLSITEDKTVTAYYYTYLYM
jgi:hypothetical protein